MLHLATATDDTWASDAVAAVDEILLEQAHLEKKAAAGALRYLFRYPDRAGFQQPLSELAREELEHFELVLRQLARRGVPFGPQVPSSYAAGLLRVVRSGEPERMVDSLLCSALIEARSCERMQLLGEALRDVDPELSAMYRELVVAEARHHGTYVRLAEECVGAEPVRQRLLQVAAHEAAVIAQSPRSPRLHG